MGEYRGIVQQGVIVLQDGALPEGTLVTIMPLASSEGKADAPSSSRDAATAPASIWGKLVALGLQVENEPCDLPPDFAANHDHYLHGLSKRQ